MKKILLFFVGLLVLCLFAGGVSAYSGSGTASDPFILTSASDLQLLSGTGIGVDPFSVSAYYELGADIDMSSEESFTPIGTIDYKFIGHFNGNNHTISNLKISLSGTSEVGLFSYINTGANIANLRFYNADVSGGSHVGVLFGECYNGGMVVSNIRVVNSSVSGTNFVGGVIGCGQFNTGSINGSYTGLYCENVYVYGTSTVGGIFGGLSDNTYTRVLTVSNCLVYNSVIISTNQYSGGIAGIGSYRGEHIITDCIVQNCYISAGSSYMGGITTRFDGGSISYTPNTPQITNCSVNRCTLNGKTYVGGIYSVNLNGPDVEVTDCTVSDCAIIGTSNVAGVGN